MRISTLVVIVSGLAAAASAAAQTPPAGDAARGAIVFQAQCAACHLAKPTDPTPIGPQLHGVVGRKAGSWDHFKYTDAMRKSGITWSPKLLDEYLENPYAVVPGAAMGLTVPVEKNRADVIAYLAAAPEELKQKERTP